MAANEGRRTHRQRAAAIARAQALGGRRDAVEGLARGAKTDLPLLGQQERPVEAAEELAPEMLLERLHLMADRGLGDVQLLGGPGEAEMARRGLEGAERVEGRETAGHRRIYR